MKKFLKQVAANILKEYDDKLSELILIFPNQRSIIFFKHYLKQQINKPVFTPQCLTITDFIKKHSELHSTDNLNLLADLFLIYKKHKKSQENFDEFYNWGETILNDFDDIDKYLANAKDLFQNIESLKEIDKEFETLSPEQVKIIQKFWQNVNPENLGQHKSQFITLWNVLYPIYEELNKVLRTKGIGYEGMIYRDASEQILNGKIEFDAGKYIFVGFNALNNCEKKVMNYLQKKNTAEFYWDYDTFFSIPEYHEAGYFIRENKIKFPAKNKISDENCFINSPKNIRLKSISSDIGQAKLLPSEIEDLKKSIEDNPDNTAIILADESLLIPVLNSLPENPEKINVTMGFPLMESPVYSLVELLTGLHENFRINSDKEHLFYYKNVLALIEHQYLFGFVSPELKEIKRRLILNNRILVNADLFKDLPFWNHIFKSVTSTSELIAYLKNTLELIVNNLLEKNSEEQKQNLEQEFIYHFYTKLNTLVELLNTNKLELNIKTFLRLLRKITQRITIPFEGQPLNGLQVMGLMETRALDFDNIIFLSMNEGKLPKSEASFTFIPYNLRRAFDLPTVNHQNSIYAYYFYRLIKRANNITFIYNTKQEAFNTGEKSRFISQLEYETEFNIKEETIGFNILPQQDKPIVINKNEDILKVLQNYLSHKKTLSPSALNTYISCSLRFFYKYIAKIKEPDEILEEIEPNMFGSILHRAMDILYQPWLNQIVNTEILSQLQKDKNQIAEAVDISFKEEYFKNDRNKKVIYSGKNLIIKDIINKYIIQLLEVDKQYCPFQIKGLELECFSTIDFSINGQKNSARIGGTIDRVDYSDNRTRIIDYKTGKADLNTSKVELLFDNAPEKQKKAIFQTFLYALAYEEETKEPGHIQPTVYPVKEIFSQKFNPYIKINKAEVVDYRENLEEFNEHLQSLLVDLFHPETRFIQTEHEKNCENCPYNNLCNKA